MDRVFAIELTLEENRKRKFYNALSVQCVCVSTKNVAQGDVEICVIFIKKENTDYSTWTICIATNFL